MNFNQACNIKDPHSMPYDKRLEMYVSLLGYEKLKRRIPYGQKELCEYYKEDRNFNNTPIWSWQEAAGYYGFKDGQCVKPPRCTGSFYELVTSCGVTDFAMSECVAILKHAAEMWVLEKIGAIYEEHWGVFAAYDRERDKAHKWDIYCFDCIATFPDEVSAIKFANEDPEHRVHKKLGGNGPRKLLESKLRPGKHDKEES